MSQTQTSKIVINRCDVDTVRDLATGLLEEHWEEVAKYKHLMKLKPDWHRYYELEEKGMLIALSVAVQEHDMIGYSASFLAPHIHYSDLMVATNDVLFLHRDWRATGVGLRLLRATEAEARERGAKMMLWHAKPDTPLSAVLPRMDYDVMDIIYGKEL